MTILWFDGFDTYGTDIQKAREAGYIVNGSNISITQTGALRTGGGCVIPGTTPIFYKLSADRATLIMCVGLYVINFNATSNEIFALHDENLGTSTAVQCCLRVNTIGRIQLMRGSNSGTLLRTTDRSLIMNVWNWIEWKITVSDASGTSEIRVNGEVWDTASGLDTKATTGTAPVRYVSTFNNSSTSFRYDDLLIIDTMGSINNDYLGERRIHTLFPSGDVVGGSYSPVPLDPDTLYDKVQEATPDDDNTYIEEDQSTGQQLFDLANLPVEVSDVDAVMAVMRSKKSDTGPLTARTRIKSGSSFSNGATINPLIGFTTQMDIFELDPATSAAWDVAGVNGLQIATERLS